MKFYSKTNKASLAFGLTEVLVGSAVAGVVLLAVFAGMGSSFEIMQLSREDMRATQIMVERLEAIRGSGWSKLTNSTPPAFTEYFTPNSSGSGGAGVAFNGVVILSAPTFATTPSPVPTYLSDMTNVTIQLTWMNSASGTTRFRRVRSMSTFVTKNGI